MSDEFVSTEIHARTSCRRWNGLQQGASAAEVSRVFEINPNLLHRWRREFRQGPGNAFPGEGKRRWEETHRAELERKVGRQTMEIDF